MKCQRPPRGWWCSLEEGHDGPCPTYATFWNFIWRKLTRKSV